jgi:hypothetical protein
MIEYELSIIKYLVINVLNLSTYMCLKIIIK